MEWKEILFRMGPFRHFTCGSGILRIGLQYNTAIKTYCIQCIGYSVSNAYTITNMHIHTYIEY